MTQLYNWPELVKDIQDDLFMSQAEIANRLKVSQQSISNWMNGTRNPGRFAIPRLLALADSGKMDVSRYIANPDFDAIDSYLKKNKGRELVRIFDLYIRMSGASKKKFLKYAKNI